MELGQPARALGGGTLRRRSKSHDLRVGDPARRLAMLPLQLRLGATVGRRGMLRRPHSHMGDDPFGGAVTSGDGPGGCVRGTAYSRALLTAHGLRTRYCVLEGHCLLLTD